MIPVRRTAALLLPLALAAALAPAAQATPRPPAPAAGQPPAPGTCWNLTYEQADRRTYLGSPVDCAQTHTIETVITLEVPAKLAAEGNDSRALVAWLDPQCQTEINRYAGVADPQTTAPGTRTWNFWFTPTKRQWNAGNHWVSCAAGSVPVSLDRTPKMKPVRGSIAGMPERNIVRTFNTERYGLGEFVARKPLTDWATRDYPGTSGLQKAAWDFCEKAIGSTKYFWYGPSEKEWYEGWTAIRCYERVKK